MSRREGSLPHPAAEPTIRSQNVKEHDESNLAEIKSIKSIQATKTALGLLSCFLALQSFHSSHLRLMLKLAIITHQPPHMLFLICTTSYFCHFSRHRPISGNEHHIGKHVADEVQPP